MFKDFKAVLFEVISQTGYCSGVAPVSIPESSSPEENIYNDEQHYDVTFECKHGNTHMINVPISDVLLFIANKSF